MLVYWRVTVDSETRLLLLRDGTVVLQHFVDDQNMGIRLGFSIGFGLTRKTCGQTKIPDLFPSLQLTETPGSFSN